MAVLIETRLNSLTLNESAKPRKGCLGRIEGVCADFKNPTRNGRFYSKKLWENVFKDPIFEESLKSKTLLGELDHPEDRLEVLAGEACIVMTDYRIDEDEGVIYAGFDILDTPRGKILKSLLDYGCVMGVSSRGQGDINNTSDGECVDEDTYDFACFDVVTTPAVAKARQNVVESVKKTKTFVESIKTQIKEAETIGDLNAIRKVVESTQTPDIDSLIESIEYRCSSISEGKTITSENKNLNVIGENINSNTSNNEDSNTLSAKTIRDNKGLNRNLVKCVNSLRQQVSALEHREKRLVSVIESKDSTITTLQKDLTKSNKVRTANTKLQGQLQTVREQLNKSNTQSRKNLGDAQLEINSLTRTLTDTENKLNQLQEQLEKTQKSNNTKDKTIKSLRQSVDSKESKISQLQESCKKYKEDITTIKTESNNTLDRNRDTIESLEQEVRSLTEQLHNCEKENIHNINESNRNTSEMEDEINSYTEIIDNLQEQLTNIRQQKDDNVKSYNTLLNENKKLSQQLALYQDNYVQVKCRQYGLDASLVSSQIDNNTSIKQVNSLLEGMQRTKDRYAKLPICENAPKGVLIKNSDITSMDEESQRLATFIEGYMNAK